MKLILEVKILGFDPVPWSAPVVTRSGVSYRKRKTKTDMMSLSLADWQKLVYYECKKLCLGNCDIHTGPVILHLTFIKRTPAGKRHGEPWFTSIEWNEDKQKWVKAGYHEPDLTNLEKALEDALEGSVLANDYQVVRKACQRVYGPQPGAVVTIYQVEPGDFQAAGEMVLPLPKPRRLRRCGPGNAGRITSKTESPTVEFPPKITPSSLSSDTITDSSISMKPAARRRKKG